MRFLVVASGLLVFLVACGGPPDKPAQSANDGVPANSASEARLSSSDPAAPTTKPASSGTPTNDAKADPTSAFVQKVGDPDPTAEKPETAPAGSKKDLKKGEKMSKAECDAALDKLLTLEFDNNPELASLPPEIRKQVAQQAKEQARQKDSADCSATKAQYRCAMAASSKPAWMACMK